MIIQGAKYWEDGKRLHVQENNAFEILVPGLEYCRDTAAANCIEALYEDIARDKGIVIQLEDYSTAFSLDQANWPMFNKIIAYNYGVGPGQTPPNRVRNLLPYIVKKCFGVDAEYRTGGTFEKVAEELWNGNAVELCIPGHYIAALAYNSGSNEIGFKDSWKADRWPRGVGVVDANNNKWFNKSDFNDISPEYVVYFKPEAKI